MTGDKDHAAQAPSVWALPSRAELSGLQARLNELSAPSPFVYWARPFADLASCWDACPTAEWLLWTAARLSRTDQDRQAVVWCATKLAQLAVRQAGRLDPRIITAITAARAWARGESDVVAVLAAESAALDAAAETGIRAADQAARARVLFAAAPRGRLASTRTGQALAAHMTWRAAEHAHWTALAAARVAWMAAQAGTAAAAPEPWAINAREAAAYVVRALSPPGTSARRQARATARCASLVRSHLSSPGSADDQQHSGFNYRETRVLSGNEDQERVWRRTGRTHRLWSPSILRFK